MNSESLLYGLLVASISLSVVLTLISTAIVGRKIADLEYQQSVGVNGAHRIQSVVNIRTHALRVLVGLTFITIALLLLAEAPEIWRQWINRTLFVLLPGTYAGASILDWMAERQQIKLQTEQVEHNRGIASALALAAEQQRTSALRADHDSYKEMAAEAIASLAIVAARSRAEYGQPPLEPVAPVVGEHSSPITPEQRATAERQTLRAQLVASTKDLGLPPREPPAPVVPPPVDVASIQKGAMQQITEAVVDANMKAPP